MGIFRKIGRAAGRLVDFRVDRWLNLQMLKNTTTYLVSETKNLFTVEQAEKTENFDQAVVRLELTPNFIDAQARRYLYLTCFFLVAAVLLLLYGIYIALHHNFMGACISFSLMIYVLSCAFRFHFWYFQMKQKKLGCSLQEWFKSIQSR